MTPRRSVARHRLEASSHCQYVTHKGLAASSEMFLVTERPAILAEGFSHHSMTNLVCAVAVFRGLSDHSLSSAEEQVGSRGSGRHSGRLIG